MPKILSGIFIGVLALTAFGGFAFAQDDTVPTRVRQEVEAYQQDVGQYREAAKEAVETLRHQLQEAKGEATQNFLRIRLEARRELELRRDEFIRNMEDARQELRRRLEERRQELKNRLEQIKNDTKRRLSERIYDNLNALNERLTIHFGNALTQLEEVLDRIASRTDKAEANGYEVSAIRAAITAAQGAIELARDAVEAQAQKVYTFQVNTEETLRLDVGEARKLLHGDLTAVRDMVKAAREAVHDAGITLLEIPQVDELELEDVASDPVEEDNSTNGE